MGTETPPTLRTGPTLAIVGSCEGCRHCRIHNGALRCMGTKERRALTGLRLRAPEWCPEMGRARGALLVSLASTLCRKCGRTVEPERECYAIPTCFACLPPPPPMTVLPSFAAWQEKQEREAATADECSAPHGAQEESDE